MRNLIRWKKYSEFLLSCTWYLYLVRYLVFIESIRIVLLIISCFVIFLWGCMEMYSNSGAILVESYGVMLSTVMVLSIYYVIYSTMAFL